MALEIPYLDRPERYPSTRQAGETTTLAGNSFVYGMVVAMGLVFVMVVVMVVVGVGLGLGSNRGCGCGHGCGWGWGAYDHFTCMQACG